jgi:hypothetical protein
MYIACLAGLAVVVTIWPPESNWSKAAWLSVFLACTGLEIATLYQERAENQDQQARTRQQQLNSFSNIATGINTAINNSQQQFAATMEGFQKTLEATNQTINNTRPRAILEFGELQGGVVPLAVNQAIMFNLHLINSGSETATHAAALAIVYIRKLDDGGSQKSILADFNARWKGEYRNIRDVSVPIGDKPFFSITSDPFTAEDVESLASQAKTVYIVSRVSWEDHIGRWATDYCSAYQDKVFTSPVMHPCGFIDAGRVRYKYVTPVVPPHPKHSP